MRSSLYWLLCVGAAFAATLSGPLLPPRAQPLGYEYDSLEASSESSVENDDSSEEPLVFNRFNPMSSEESEEDASAESQESGEDSVEPPAVSFATPPAPGQFFAPRPSPGF